MKSDILAMKLKKAFVFSNFRFTQFALLFILICTTYIGISINGGDKGWIYVNGVLRDFCSNGWSSLILRNHFYGTAINLLSLFINIIIYFCAILVFTRHNKIAVLHIPVIYLIITLVYFPLMVILLIPYILLLSTLILYTKYSTENKR